MTSVRDVLNEARTRYRRVYFRPVHGNAGDALIAAGFYQLAEEIGLDYTELQGAPLAVPSLTSEDLLILNGGGWFTSHWGFGQEQIDSLTRFDPALLVLPQSVHDADAALARMRPQDTLFVRERYSLNYVTAANPACTVHLDDDMAVGIDPEWVMAAAPHLRRPGDRHDPVRYAALARLRARALREPVLQAWRTDAEATGLRPDAPWRGDLSLVANFGVLDRRSALFSAAWFLRALSWYRRVETDRLHVAVGAALLGIPVEVHANNYHKIRGVFEQSLRDRSPFDELVTFSGPGDSSA